MRKLLYLVVFAPSLAIAAGAGGINFTPNAKALLNSTNTFTAAQTFSSITVTGNCGGCGGTTPGATFYILNTDLLTPSTFYVSSGTVGGNLTVVGNLNSYGAIRSSNNLTVNNASFTTVNVGRGSVFFPTVIFGPVSDTTGFYSPASQQVALSIAGGIRVLLADTASVFSHTIQTQSDSGPNGQSIQFGVSGAGMFSPSSGDVFFRNGNGKGGVRVYYGSFGALGAGRLSVGGGIIPRASLHVSSTDPNLPMLLVSSSTQYNFTITGSSITSTIPFLIAPTSTTGFGVSPSTYALAVASVTAFNGRVADPPFNFSISTTAHINSNGTSPTLGSCGSSPSVFGSDNAFTITPGATAGGCTATFARPFFNLPTCTVSEQTLSLVNALSYVVTNTAVTITQTGLTSKLDVVCVGHD